MGVRALGVMMIRRKKLRLLLGVWAVVNGGWVEIRSPRRALSLDFELCPVLSCTAFALSY
jgi:hypothetical protein